MGAELVVGIKSRFDAAGSEAAAAGFDNVTKGVGRAGNAAKKLGSDFVDLEIKHRRIESATRVLGTEFANMGRSGFTMAAAAESGASAISLLGNSVRFASGPIGIAVTVATALASALLMWSANAKEATEKTKELMTGVQALRFAQQILEAKGKGVESGTIQRIKSMVDEATATANMKALTDARSAAANKLADALQAQANAQNALNTADANRPKNVSGVKETEYDRAAYGNDKLAEALKKTKTATTEASAEVALFDAAVARASGRVWDLGNIDDLIAARQKQGWDERSARVEKYISDLDKLVAAVDEAEKEQTAIVKAAEAEQTRDRITAIQTAGTALGTLATFAEAAAGSELEVVKGLRAAEAVINGIAAGQQAVATYGPTPLGYAVAAVAVAGGIAAAAQIMSTQRGSASASAPAVPSFGGSQGPSANPSPVGSNVGAAPAAPGYSGQRGGFSGTMNLTVNMQVNVLDPDAINNATLRRLGRRMAEIILFEINALGGTVSWQ